MAMDYKTPNVYVEEVSTLPPSVAGVATAIPAFIGYTEKAGRDGENLTNRPTRTRSLKEFEDLFGMAPATDFKVDVVKEKDKEGNVTYVINNITTPEIPFLMHYSLRMFFNNGGESCYIVSVGNFSGGKPAKGKLNDGLGTLEKEDEPTLIVFPDGHALGKDYYGLCKNALMQCKKLKDRFAIIDVLDTNDGIDAQNFRNSIGMEALKYGAAYCPYLQTSLNYNYTDDSIVINVTEQASKDSGGKGGKGDKGSAKLEMKEIRDENTELYNKIKAELNKKRVTLPPSPAVAGVYASVDRDRGVWKAPANVSLSTVMGPTVKITNDDQEDLNVDPTGGKSINAIRSFTGKGSLIWGARTLAGNDNEWRYIPVRRLFNYIEESIRKASSFVVFEPNTAMTWLKVRTMIESFLDNLWRQGALAGATPEQAFFVHVGLGTTMTEQDILEGRIVIEIGVAAVRPAEFIILRFTHKLQES